MVELETRAIAKRDQLTGRGVVIECKRCQSLVEVITLAVRTGQQ